MEFNWASEAERLWDEKSGSWSRQSREMWESGSRKDIAGFFSGHVPAGSSVCDLGCGDGFGTLKLASAGYKVTGADVSEEMIHKAIKVNEGNDASFIKTDIASLDVPDDAFDAVLAINSLEWTESPLAVLREMQRVVRPGGYGCIGILGPTAKPRENSYERLYGKKAVCNTMMPWEFARLAVENGWSRTAGFGVYKRSAEQIHKGSLTEELQQALSFMWVFMIKNNK
ncbi:class I SAM-dependent methyltransferase [Bacillus infantis]|uniref:class I SAM-dependent methyltransferase n=1 Tax=Bacillus infantis TaxID=324767 RepID=UPI0021550A98|nr:class I SAM-dependent methyltransferase [Bacillus infantis]MCR6611681.1 class I SAM-dependent methyltransferase [Bacillus infantis]